MPVTHCVCHNLSFKELQLRAQRDGLGFPQLRAATGCSTSCAMCEPYVRLMLHTGQTTFEPLTPREADEILRQKLGETPNRPK